MMDTSSPIGDDQHARKTPDTMHPHQDDTAASRMALYIVTLLAAAPLSDSPAIGCASSSVVYSVYVRPPCWIV
jgi:hypothetical protein